MRLVHLDVEDFRCFTKASFEPALDGTTILTGPNGCGKTTFLEALGFLGAQPSFTQTPKDAFIRVGTTRAFVRAEITDTGRTQNLGVEIGKGVATKKRLPIPMSVLAPSDPGIIQGGPQRRRDLLDQALELLEPEAPWLLLEVGKILRQRAALLRQTGDLTSLEIWDGRLSVAGSQLASMRANLVANLEAHVVKIYGQMGTTYEVGLAYERSWVGDLKDCLFANRKSDLRRGVTSVGPHRDDLAISLEERDTRHQSSQGEQRSLAIALRLGVHQAVTEHLGHPPILLLDDVFSELDPKRCESLVSLLPGGQAFLTTATPVPENLGVKRTIDLSAMAKS